MNLKMILLERRDIREILLDLEAVMTSSLSADRQRKGEVLPFLLEHLDSVKLG